MQCNDINNAFEHISAYYNGNYTGHILLVNAENYDDYQSVLSRLQADKNKRIFYVSKYCFENGLPNIDAVVAKTVSRDDHAIVGISQALMLRGEEFLEAKIDELLSQSISGHTVVLLDHCESIIKKFIERDLRINNRVVMVEGKRSDLPRIEITDNKDLCLTECVQDNINGLFSYLEKITDSDVDNNNTVAVVSQLSLNAFKNSVYQIAQSKTAYEVLIEKFSDIRGGTEESFGTKTNWEWLLQEMKSCNSFSELVCSYYGSISSISLKIRDTFSTDDKNKKWLLWLSLKVFKDKTNKYLSLVIDNSTNEENFVEHIYLDLSDIKVIDSNFKQYFEERKKLIAQLPKNKPLIEKYCDNLSLHQKDKVYYLSDDSDEEKYEFVKCLCTYDYSREEIVQAVNSMSKQLSLYLNSYVFDETNTKLSETDVGLRNEFTEYFNEYKLQKLTNKIYPEFLDKVNEYATSHLYNKLQPRSSIISRMNREDMQLFFFDALGVEYLSFIVSKCEEYGLIAEVSIAHCELPSITSKNKEFTQYFSSDNYRKIDKLDEIKHHSQIYNYEKVKLPLHIFEELDVIDKELESISTLLMQDDTKKALIVSDHGASRLAVTYGHESDSKIVLDESAEHSGRCCLAETDPNISCAAYEDGYSVLANYERFKGGRKANVEVHGGASLEEVLVPIIVLTKRPKDLKICFVDSTIILVPRTIPELKLFSNIPIKKPRIRIADEFFDGEYEDDKVIKFILPKIKRKGEYTAEVFDDDTNLSVTLKFKAQKRTTEVDLF